MVLRGHGYYRNSICIVWPPSGPSNNEAPVFYLAYDSVTSTGRKQLTVTGNNQSQKSIDVALRRDFNITVPPLNLRLDTIADKCPPPAQTFSDTEKLQFHVQRFNSATSSLFADMTRVYQAFIKKFAIQNLLSDSLRTNWQFLFAFWKTRISTCT